MKNPRSENSEEQLFRHAGGRGRGGDPPFQSHGWYQQELQWVRVKNRERTTAPSLRGPTWPWLMYYVNRTQLEMAKHTVTIGLELERQAVFG